MSKEKLKGETIETLFDYYLKGGTEPQSWESVL